MGDENRGKLKIYIVELDFTDLQPPQICTKVIIASDATQAVSGFIKLGLHVRVVQEYPVAVGQVYSHMSPLINPADADAWKKYFNL